MSSGYDELVHAGASLTNSALLRQDPPPSDEEASQFLDDNAEQLEAARSVLEQDCCVPLRYEPEFFQQHVEAFSPLRDLANSFAWEVERCAKLERFDRAVEIGMGILKLANAVRRGGLIVDAQVSTAIECMAIDRLRRMRLRLSADAARRLSDSLAEWETERESFEEVARRDRAWEQKVGHEDEPDRPERELSDGANDEDCGVDDETRQAIDEMLHELSQLPEEDIRAWQCQLDTRSIALARLLSLECALIAFRIERNSLPAGLMELVPQYMDGIPQDPFAGKNFRYAKRGESYIVYSPGPNGVDSNGKYGDWVSVSCGTADLSVDTFDYGPACSVPSRDGSGRWSRWFAFIRRTFFR